MSTMLRWIVSALIFAALLYAVDRYVGWHQVISQWSAISLIELFLLTLLTLLSYLLRAERIYRYFGAIKQHPRTAYIRISFLHNALNNFLPMRLGEAAFPLLMKRELQQSVLHSSAGLVWIRLMDLHALLLLASVALGSLLPVTGYLILAGLILGPVLLGSCHRSLLKALPRHWQQQITRFEHLLPSSRMLILTTYLQTLVIWIIKLAALTLVLQAFLPIGFTAAWIAVTSADLSSVLPIHGLAGTGTYEAAMLAALLPQGFDAERALAAAVNLHIYLLAISALSIPLALLIPRSGGGSQGEP